MFNELIHEAQEKKEILIRERDSLLRDLRELDETITIGEYASEIHKTATNAVEFIGVGKMVTGGFRLVRGVGRLLGKIRWGSRYAAQQTINKSLAIEGGQRTISHLVSEGASDALEGGAIYGMSKIGQFGDAMNHGQETLNGANSAREQLLQRLDEINQQLRNLQNNGD